VIDAVEPYRLQKQTARQRTLPCLTALPIPACGMKNLTRLLCVFGLLLSVAFAESLDEMRKKAEKGDAKMQYTLGLMYVNGMGVIKDYEEAVKWFRLAADQGQVSAQDYLGTMYREGTGVPKDLVQAHAWFNIANAAGEQDAMKNLAWVEKEMTPEQVAKAMKLARELFAKLPKKK
jgi:TPR repeat protein